MFVSTQEAADYLEVSPGEVRRLLNNGLLEGKRMPEGASYGIWCVKKTDLERYQKERRPRGRPKRG